MKESAVFVIRSGISLDISYQHTCCNISGICGFCHDTFGDADVAVEDALHESADNKWPVAADKAEGCYSSGET